MNCNQCQYVSINTIGCHETGCPNISKASTKSKARIYVGIVKGSMTRQVMRMSLPPTRHYYPEYGAFIGPFKTLRAAKWVRKNPYGWSHISEAEVLAKGGK